MVQIVFLLLIPFLLLSLFDLLQKFQLLTHQFLLFTPYLTKYFFHLFLLLTNHKIREFENLCSWKPFLRVNLKHVFDQLLEVLRKSERNAFELSPRDFLCQCKWICSFKRPSERGNLIKNTSCRPNIRLLIVSAFLNLLWTHVVRCTNIGLCEFRMLSKFPAESEIS